MFCVITKSGIRGNIYSINLDSSALGSALGEALPPQGSELSSGGCSGRKSGILKTIQQRLPPLSERTCFLLSMGPHCVAGPSAPNRLPVIMRLNSSPLKAAVLLAEPARALCNLAHQGWHREETGRPPLGVPRRTGDSVHLSPRRCHPERRKWCSLGRCFVRVPSQSLTFVN